MKRLRKPSPQACAVLAALLRRPRDWRHGYEISADTRLKSGTLYPILMRLAAQGLLESQWRDSEHAGRPQRHLYRLTADGAAFARTHATAPAATNFAGQRIAQPRGAR